MCGVVATAAEVDFLVNGFLLVNGTASVTGDLTARGGHATVCNDEQLRIVRVPPGPGRHETLLPGQHLDSGLELSHELRLRGLLDPEPDHHEHARKRTASPSAVRTTPVRRTAGGRQSPFCGPGRDGPADWSGRACQIMDCKGG